MSVAIVDNGGANMSSLLFALQRLGVNAELTCDRRALDRASHIILPGVGHAADSMARLHEKQLVGYLQNTDKPLLGICLGMQLLYEQSAEGDTECLGIVPGKVTQIMATVKQPSPHMGWNQIEYQTPHPLLANIVNGSYLYFVHSYAAPPGDATIALTQYADSFTSIVAEKNFLGVQFHPERSGPVGASLLANFVGTIQ